jgi:hypothetical protein
MTSSVIVSVIGFVAFVGVAFAALSAVVRLVDRRDEKAFGPSALARKRWVV